MIHSKFFIDFNLLQSEEKLENLVNSIGERKYIIESDNYLNGLIKKYANNEKYNVSMSQNAFAITLWTLKAINQNALTSRFIIDQRDVTEYNLTVEGKKENENISTYCNMLGIEVSIVDNLFKTPFEFFISNNKKISGYKYRLIYQKLESGYVYLEMDQLIHILREYFVKKIMDIYNKINKNSAQTIFRQYGDKIENYRETFKEINTKNQINLGDVDFSIFPPCIKAYITEIRDGGNPSHMARLTLATFLHHIGMPNEDIVKTFKGTADFDENSATYQINHLTGKISGTEYSPPKCATLRSNHLCYMGDDKLCPKIKHPLQYYEVKKKSKKS